ncbi:MAG: alkaline phosphatase family protein [Microbacteriaceae bacterium]
MLPALKTGGPRLADVLTSCLAAVSGKANKLRLSPVERAVVVLVDGLGASALKAHAGHARTLMGRVGPASVIESGFPTTTAAALASLTTGASPGEHGMVGYSVRDVANDRVVKLLSGWDSLMDPQEWQPFPTVFERATHDGLGAVVIGPERFRSTGYTQAVLRGATYLGATRISDRVDQAVQWLRTPGQRGIAYVYVPELDSVGHAHGIASNEWTNKLEIVDGAIADLARALTPRDGLLVTADHGMIDIPVRSHVFFDRLPGLVDGVRFAAGEPRCLQLYVEPDAGVGRLDSLLTAWREAEGERAWILSRNQAIDAGWFGAVRSDVSARIGDLVVAARKNVAYYDGRAPAAKHPMIGQHGSWTPAEIQIPVLRFGAFSV